MPQHVSLGLTAAQSADRIAQKFADISQEFPPLQISNLPERIKKLLNEDVGKAPYISRQMVEENIRKANSTKGGVPGDLPVKLLKEFGPELAVPASQMFRKVAATGDWPKRWRTERGISLKKVPEPVSEEELRIISLTPFFSKTFEQITLDWLLPYISDKMDWNQYGGIRGTSVSHYLIEIVTFILYNQDLNEPRAVIAAMVDFEKAFNRQNHAKLITKLGDWGVPA